MLLIFLYSQWSSCFNNYDFLFLSCLLAMVFEYEILFPVFYLGLVAWLKFLELVYTMDRFSFSLIITDCFAGFFSVWGLSSQSLRALKCFVPGSSIFQISVEIYDFILMYFPLNVTGILFLHLSIYCIMYNWYFNYDILSDFLL